MKVVVGSTNKGKIEAVKLAFEKVWPKEKIEVSGISVSSGVSKQPMDVEEGIEGARNRAKNAMEKDKKADYAVGAEGGVYQIGNTYLECGWIVVLDQNGNEGIGSSPHLLVAPEILAFIAKGMELTDAMGKVIEKTPDKEKEGYFGYMTNDVITRITGYSDGVVMALVRFIHPELFTEKKEEQKESKEKHNGHTKGLAKIPSSFGEIAPVWREEKKAHKKKKR